MADNKNQQGFGTGSSNASKNNQVSKSNNSNNILAEISELSTKAETQLTESDLANIDTSNPQDGFSMQECWYKAKIFEAATKRAEEQSKNLTLINQEKRQLEIKSQELLHNQEKLEHQEGLLNSREEQLRQRELNAEAGFLQQREALLAEIKTQSQEIEESKNELAVEKRLLRREKNNIETERELLEEDKQALENKINQKAASEVEKLKARIEYQQEQLKQISNVRNQVQSTLIKRQEADRRFGQKTPEEIIEELDLLRRQKSELEQTIASRPSESAVARLQELESQKEQWENERFRLSTRLQELERSTAYNRIAVTELETIRDEKEAFEASNSRLKAALQELRADVNEALVQSQNISPFPECSRMDTNTSVQTKTLLNENNLDLKEFAEGLRYRIALSPLTQDSSTQKRLYYSARDIRTFLGGLAMSHLHILQGISGTGKTSLPIAFARAIGGQYKLVEIQAGWRDRQDLIGYFNAFEGRFYESDFLKALYEAQCPANQERIYIIILDEMNLSRTEQYFADFLSKLEQDAPTISLTTDLNKPSPKLFQNQNILPVPPNVWFVGTANQDETTLEFADKTYDRAHIMQLQRSHESFDTPPQLVPALPVSHQALMHAFQHAQKKYINEASEVYQYLNTTLADLLERKFKVAWGNRLERQINDFVPVIIATGGSSGEACDHILATKILRKIRDRHDTLTNDLRKLKDDLDQSWSTIDPHTQPEQSLLIINTEIRRLEPCED
jgi:hypothetical protein